MPKGAISGIINIAFLAISIGTGVFVVKETQSISSEASSDFTTISLSTNETTFTNGSRFAVSIKLDTANNPVGYINSVIDYDPQYLKAINISPGTFFENQVVLESKTDQVAGQAIFTIENAPGTTPLAGKGIVAFLVFEPIKPGSTTISILPLSKVAINNSLENQLQSFNHLSISIK